MTSRRTPLAILFQILLLPLAGMGQETVFSNISTINGLSDNFIRSIETDQNGFLWIGTNEGLNSYDGYSVTHYSQESFPEIPDKTIIHLFCDSRNRVWMGSKEGVAWADENRRFHRLFLQDTIRKYHCGLIIEAGKLGILLFTDRGVFGYHPETGTWEDRSVLPQFPEYARLREVISYDKSSILVCSDSLVERVDISSGKKIFSLPFQNAQSLCRAPGNAIAVLSNKGICHILDAETGKLRKEYNLVGSFWQSGIPSVWSEIRPAAGNNLLAGSFLHGFMIIDPEGKITRFRHDPSNPYSIAGDRCWRVLGTEDGTVIVGTERYGLSIFNILKRQAAYKKFFRDDKGELYDGYLTEMIQDRDGNFWIGAFDRLIRWHKETDRSVFYRYDNLHKGTGIRYPEINRVCLDRKERMWVGLVDVGPALFNRESGMFSPVFRDSSVFTSMKSNYVTDIFEDSQGRIWTGTLSGMYWINPSTRKAESLENDPVFGSISHLPVRGFVEDRQHRLWISTSARGMFCYDPVTRKLSALTQKEGLLDDICLDLMYDSRGDLYISHYKGFSIIRAGGRIEKYTRASGLRYDKADSFLEDNQGMIWISNAKCLVRFDPQTHRMDLFDEHENLNNGGFKPASAWKNAAGELFWGTQSGINYFFPDHLTSGPESLRVSISKALAGDSLITGEPGKVITVPWRNRNLQFHFVAINLRGFRNIRYQYRLEGYDSHWQEGTDIRQARYSSLPPGYYTFHVRAGMGDGQWMESSNQVRFSVLAPVYMRSWFRILGVLAILSLLIIIFHRRSRQLKMKKEELETEKAIHYFATSMHEYQEEEDILWDVARNCIGRFQFEDCVIYLVEEKKHVLIQKAAHGPKSPRNHEISQPIEIPFGKGIVGSVALSAKPEIIPDTTLDPRYIVDDERRYSEISVPIIYNGQVLGVIDCKHSKKRFFTQKHLSILNTIASLCANKIIRARTEQEKKQAEHMLTETKHKMAEAEMQALRAQMNPHFIFNCLNSINRYIVKSDQATASLYLTRFAKLIRLILDNSHTKNVVLSNELEALRLYIEMESLRFENKFTYAINVDPDVPENSIEIPPLIIQPYIENAIWHGLLHKAEGGHLSVHVSLLPGNLLRCVVEDNGIGRDKARELKSKSATTRKSLGMELTENRLLLLNKYAAVHSSIEIEDIINEAEEVAGTRVILRIPYAD
ncbi:MAG: two-component regulator propeller domain-containing protein [Chitinophagaceae bacterium]